MSLLRLCTAIVAGTLLATTTADLVWYGLYGGLPIPRPIHYAALVIGAACLLLTEGHRRLDALDRRVKEVESEVSDQSVRSDLASLLHMIDH